ncbi:hypothetical protein LPJ59_005535 [Coemansia sp. RSA 2399]|nr:hypothetical protein LPJ59_005535 [Coemansia sp. RSA 2399]
MAVCKLVDGDSELEIDEQTFVKNTDEMDGGRKTDVCRLRRYFYGTKQSVHGWNKCLNTHLCDWVDFECLDAGQGVHVKHLDDGRVCIEIIHIDNILIAAQPDDKLADIGKNQTIVGPLQCITGTTRSVSAHAASVLRSLNSKPTVTYLCAAKDSIRYLKQSAKFGIKHSQQPAHRLAGGTGANCIHAGADAANGDCFSPAGWLCCDLALNEDIVCY